MEFYLQDYYLPLNVLVSIVFSENLCNGALDVTADIVEAARNADMLSINVSEDFQ